MADLDPLIRFRKHGVDEKRRAIAELYRQLETCLQKKETVEQEIRDETALAEQMASVEAVAYLGRYLQGAREKIRAIEIAARKIETRIVIAQEDMRTAFAEMKKVEIVSRSRKRREKKAQAQKENAELDEIAIDQFRRKDQED